jgi:nucleotide-binding universal stress UspA family protein
MNVRPGTGGFDPSQSRLGRSLQTFPYVGENAGPQVMSYRTILVHLNDPRRARRLLSYAIDLARHFEAHLIGQHVAPKRSSKRAVPAVADTLQLVKGSLEEEIRSLKAIFESMATNGRSVGEWRSLGAARRDPATSLVARTRAADLVIASQEDPEWALSPVLDCPGRLAIESGRPVIVVPNEGAVPARPGHVVVAWNHSRQSARALFDALPLLKGARRVEIVIIDGASDGDLDIDEDAMPVGAATEALLRHGVRPVITKLKSNRALAGDVICSRASDQNADLIVMGAFGHARMHEYVFSGATQIALETAPVPVLFSH